MKVIVSSRLCDNKELAGDDLVFAVVEELAGGTVFERMPGVAELLELVDEREVGEVSVCGFPGRDGNAERGARCKL